MPCSPRLLALRTPARGAQAAAGAVLRGQLQLISKMCLAACAAPVSTCSSRRASVGARLTRGGSDASDAPTKYLAAAPTRTAREALHAHGIGRPSEWPGRNRGDGADRRPAGRERGRRAALERRRAAARTRNFAALPGWISSTSKNTGACGKRAHGYFSLNMAVLARLFLRCKLVRQAIWAIIPATAGARDRGRDDPSAAALPARSHRFADDIFGFKVDWVNEFAAALAERRRRRAVHHPAARGSRQPAHGRCAAQCRLPGSGLGHADADVIGPRPSSHQPARREDVIECSPRYPSC